MVKHSITKLPTPFQKTQDSLCFVDHTLVTTENQRIHYYYSRCSGRVVYRNCSVVQWSLHDRTGNVQNSIKSWKERRIEVPDKGSGMPRAWAGRQIFPSHAFTRQLVNSNLWPGRRFVFPQPAGNLLSWSLRPLVPSNFLEMEARLAFLKRNGRPSRAAPSRARAITRIATSNTEIASARHPLRYKGERISNTRDSPTGSARDCYLPFKYDVTLSVPCERDKARRVQITRPFLHRVA